MTSRQSLSNRDITAASRPADANMIAVIRVTISPSPDGQGYRVSIEPQKCPPDNHKPPQGQGKVSPDLCREFDRTFTTLSGLSECIGVPEGDVLREADGNIERHAQQLLKVLWGEEVWEENSRAWRAWWKTLKNHRSIEFLAIELVLCAEMQKYIWESLLISKDLPVTKVAIVRIRHEDLEELQSFHHVRKPIWLGLLSDPNRELGNLVREAQHILDNLGPAWSFERVPLEYETGRLKSMSDKLKSFPADQMLCFLYLGHAKIENDKTFLEIEADDHRPDLATLDRLRTAFDQREPTILLLVACWLGRGWGDRPIDQLLEMPTVKVIVAMQLPLTNQAATTLLEQFFEEDPTGLYSMEELLRRVMSVRRELRIKQSTHIEAATIVIYSRVPVEIPDAEAAAKALASDAAEASEESSGCLLWLGEKQIQVRIVIVSLVLLSFVGVVWGPQIWHSFTTIARLPITIPVLISTPTPTPPATVTPTVTVVVTFTITCADNQRHVVQASQPITLSAVNAVFIESNVAPKHWEALTGTLLRLPGEAEKFSYAPSGSGFDMVTFTFVTNKETGEVTTKVLPITIVPEQRGLCYP